jgi:hypothetical protein
VQLEDLIGCLARRAEMLMFVWRDFKPIFSGITESREYISTEPQFPSKHIYKCREQDKEQRKKSLLNLNFITNPRLPPLKKIGNFSLIERVILVQGPC